MPHYVIVGAGSAGCVLAARLSEDPAAEVVLIEAGGPDSGAGDPHPCRLVATLQSQFDWDYATEPEPALDGRRLYLPRGKTFGGSSSMNAMIYMRGNRADYDGWARDGAKGWGYDDVLPYFRRSEERARRRPVPRQSRTALGQRGPFAQSADGRLCSGRDRGRSSEELGLQRRSRKASAISNSLSAMACAAAPPWPSCIRRCSDRTSG